MRIDVDQEAARALRGCDGDVSAFLRSFRYAKRFKNKIDLIVSRVECSREEAAQFLKNNNNDIAEAVVALKERLSPEVESSTKLL